ncbi:MAG: helix-turn-helix transcriptional regulator [Ruminococcaceae bacterium]|nr:helix-turn-helix transcriptional regulator [Oscillospiraceae bacterium]MBO5006084.1 helix-turn-helix transcriptional regulator [Clostridia bacterium]
MKWREARPENNISITYACAGSADYERDSEFSGAKLPFEMFLCVENGSAALTVGEEQFLLSKGESLLIPCDTEYRIEAREKSALVYVGFEARIFTVLRILSLFDYPIFFGADSSIFGICRDIAAMRAENEFTSTRLENAVKTVSLIYSAVSYITENSVPLKTVDAVMNGFAPLSDVLSYIGAHLAENIMQETLAGIAGLSPDSFYREFKKVIGHSPKDYIIAERLRRARAMFVLTELSVGEVSAAVGYENQFYFSGLFSKKYGISPTGYKKSVDRIV